MYDLSGLENNEDFNADNEWEKIQLELSQNMNFPYEAVLTLQR